MRKIYNLFTLVISVILLGACSDDKESVFVASDVVPSTLSPINESYILSAESSDFATFSFTQADFGVKVARSYELEASLQEDFAEFKQLGQTTFTGENGNMTVIAETMNSAILEWDVEAEQPTTVYFRIKTSATDSSSQPTDIYVYSNVISSIITAYSGERIYPMVYVIGSYSNWKWVDGEKKVALNLFSFNSDTNYEGVIDFNGKASEGFKITGQTNWDNGNYGTSGAADSEASEITLIDDGGSGNISCYSKRFYHFSFSKETLVLKKNYGFNVLSIVGNAGDEVYEWADPEKNGKEVDMNFDPEKQRFYADVELADGEIKFRADHDWALSFGSSNEGLLDSGDNIKVTAGKYRVYVNLNNSSNKTYELNAADYQK